MKKDAGEKSVLVVDEIPSLIHMLALESAVTTTDPPDFVYGIFLSPFAFFNVFRLNMWLQYRGLGPLRSDLFGESHYLLLSLTAKSRLA